MEMARKRRSKFGRWLRNNWGYIAILLAVILFTILILIGVLR
jgi:hypothetical protein